MEKFLEIYNLSKVNQEAGHMDKIKGEGAGGGGRWVQLGWGGEMGRKGIQL